MRATSIFSPSGHRLYVAKADGDLLILDRFSGDPLGQIRLPGPAKGLREDEYGQYLLVQPAEGDSAWVIDIGRSRMIGGVATKWETDLPTVAAPNTLLVRRGSDVVGLNLAAETFPETGRVKDGAADLWLAVTLASAPRCRGTGGGRLGQDGGGDGFDRRYTVGLSAGQQLSESDMGQ